MGDAQNGIADEQEVVAMRNKALSLLKSKMKRSRRAVRGKDLPQHHQQLEQHVADERMEDRSETDHQNDDEADEEASTSQMEVHERMTSQQQPDDSSLAGHESICIIRSKCSKTMIREIITQSHSCSSDSSCNQREEHGEEREEEKELTIAQLKQKTVVVFEGSSSRRQGQESNTHSKPLPAAMSQSATATITVTNCIKPITTATRPSPDNEGLQVSSKEQQEQEQEAKNLKKLVVKWSCRTCNRECIPIREESRCLCGHRYKEHPSSSSDPRVKNKVTFRTFACTSAKCACKSFFYVVAEGAWILRCRCKHKHVDHDPSVKPYYCTKSNCSCSGFDSPWICNCDHPWAEHTQEAVEKQFKPLFERFQEQFQVEELNCVQRTDLFAEPFVQS